MFVITQTKNMSILHIWLNIMKYLRVKMAPLLSCLPIGGSQELEEIVEVIADLCDHVRIASGQNLLWYCLTLIHVLVHRFTDYMLTHSLVQMFAQKHIHILYII